MRILVSPGSTDGGAPNCKVGELYQSFVLENKEWFIKYGRQNKDFDNLSLTTILLSARPLVIYSIGNFLERFWQYHG